MVVFFCLLNNLKIMIHHRILQFISENSHVSNHINTTGSIRSATTVVVSFEKSSTDHDTKSYSFLYIFVLDSCIHCSLISISMLNKYMCKHYTVFIVENLCIYNQQNVSTISENQRKLFLIFLKKKIPFTCNFNAYLSHAIGLKFSCN